METEALAIDMAAVGAMGDPDLARASASVLAKVAATLTDEREQHLLHAVSKVYRPEPQHAATPDTALIRKACWREEKLTFCYADEHGAATERTILPLALVYTERRSVVLAWCLLRDAFRMFRLDRVRDARTGAGSFRPHRASLLKAYLEQLRHEEASPANPHGP